MIILSVNINYLQLGNCGHFILKSFPLLTLSWHCKCSKQYKLQNECVYLGLYLFNLTLYGLRKWMRGFMANCF